MCLTKPVSTISLSRLAAEICLCIADNLSQCDLNALCRTNRHFWALLNRYLYRYNARYHGASALFWAAQYGQNSTAEYSLKEGADINSTDTSKRTPLLAAVERWVRLYGFSYVFNYKGIAYPTKEGDDAMIRLFLEKGADINAPNWTGLTPLHIASEAENGYLARLLLENGADIHATDELGRTALHMAARTGREAVISLLAEKGCDIDARDLDQKTPLHTAVGSGKDAVVRLLVELGADVNTANINRQTPLHTAAGNVMTCHTQLINIMRLLIEKGADIEARCHCGSTPLHVAASGGCSEETFQLLIDMGADTTATDTFGFTVLQRGVRARRRYVIDKLARRSQRLAKKPRLQYIYDDEIEIVEADDDGGEYR
ncbi:hypothetical protein VTO42DRAFT_3021 [Malbranchea cinnamomea]